MAYDLATVTNSGNQLLASVVPDKSSLVIDKIEVSGTQLASSTDLKTMTSISNVVQTLSANGYQKKDNSFIISTVLDNSSVKVDYKAWVFGIWAHKADGGSSVLMSVITSTNSPDTISKGSGTPIDYNYKFITTFSNTDSLKIKMSSDTYATNDTVLHNSGDETATGTKTFQEIKISNKKFPSLVQTDGQYVTLDGGNSELIPANDSKVVHSKDMRKPASDVAGIEEVNAKQDKITYTPADDSKVVHDNKDGTEQLNGVRVQPYNKLSDTIGGRNLLINTARLNDSTVCLDNKSNISDTYLGLNIYQTKHQWDGVRIYWPYVASKIKTNTNYVMSEYVRNTSPTKSASIAILATEPGLGTGVVLNSKWGIFATLPPNSGWTRISAPVNVASFPTTLSDYKLRFENTTALTDGYVQFAGLKLEQGSIATDWTPAPEDKVNVSDMRKPASDVAGIEEVNAKQDKIGYTPADDSKVLHTTTTELNSTDMNTVKTAGFYRLNSGTNGMPLADKNDNWTIYQVIPLADSNGVQIAYQTNHAILGMRAWNSYNKFTGWVQFADDSKVAHLSGANNFDTVPTVNDNPLLLASSLPSDLARTGQANTFNLTQTFSQGAKTLQTGSYDDANSLVNEGLYYNTNSSIKNGAGSLTTGYIQVMSGYGGIVRQIMYSDTDGGVIYDRTSQNGGSSWSDWTQIVTWDQLPSNMVLNNQDTNFTAKLQQNGQDVALANHTLARNPDTGKATDAIDFDPGKLTIGGNPAFSIVMCTNEADAKAKSAVNPNPIYVYPKES